MCYYAGNFKNELFPTTIVNILISNINILRDAGFWKIPQVGQAFSAIAPAGKFYPSRTMFWPRADTNKYLNCYVVCLIFMVVLPMDRRGFCDENEYKHDVIRTIFNSMQFDWLLNFVNRLYILFDWKCPEWGRVWTHFHQENLANPLVILSRRFNRKYRNYNFHY